MKIKRKKSTTPRVGGEKQVKATLDDCFDALDIHAPPHYFSHNPSASIHNRWDFAPELFGFPSITVSQCLRGVYEGLLPLEEVDRFLQEDHAWYIPLGDTSFQHSVQRFEEESFSDDETPATLELSSEVDATEDAEVKRRIKNLKCARRYRKKIKENLLKLTWSVEEKRRKAEYSYQGQIDLKLEEQIDELKRDLLEKITKEYVECKNFFKITFHWNFNIFSEHISIADSFIGERKEFKEKKDSNSASAKKYRFKQKIIKIILNFQEAVFSLIIDSSPASTQSEYSSSTSVSSSISHCSSSLFGSSESESDERSVFSPECDI